MYTKSKYYADYVRACISARENIKDQEEYNKCITGLNNWMEEHLNERN